MVPTPNQLREKCLFLPSFQVCRKFKFCRDRMMTFACLALSWGHRLKKSIDLLSVRQWDEGTWDDNSSRTSNYDIFVSQPIVSQQLSQTHLRLTKRLKLSLKNAHNPELNPPRSFEYHEDYIITCMVTQNNHWRQCPFYGPHRLKNNYAPFLCNLLMSLYSY